MTTPKFLTPVIIQKLIEKNPDGFTVNGLNFEPIGKDVTGYAVGGIIPSMLIDRDDYDSYDMEVFCSRFEVLQDVLGDKLYLGGWANNNTLCLDAVVMTQLHYDAKLLSATWAQLAYGCIKNGEYVGTKTVDSVWDEVRPSNYKQGGNHGRV